MTRQTLRVNTLLAKAHSEKFMSRLRFVMAGSACDAELREAVPNAFDTSANGTARLFGVPYAVVSVHAKDLCTVVLR